MAGRNQHIIPRFLLKNFSFRQKKKSSYAWLFRKGSDPVGINISKATEYHFYGKADEGLDDDITLKERGYANLVEQVLKDNQVATDRTPLIIEFVVHLSIRTKHTRSSFQDYAIAKFKQVATPALDDYKNYVSRLCSEQPHIFADAFMKKNNIPSYLWDKERPKYLKLVSSLCESGVLGGISSTSDMRLEVQKVISQLPEQISKSAKPSHITALRKAGISPLAMQRKIEHLEWSVKKYPSNSLVLGDVGVWCIDASFMKKPLFWCFEVVKEIYVPLSHCALLVGVEPGRVLDRHHNWINKATVELSLERFYSSSNTIEEQSLVKVLGSKDFLPDW